MKVTESEGELSSPRLYAFLIGLVAASFSVVIMFVLLIPIIAFGDPDFSLLGIGVLGIALSIFSVSYVYGLLQVCSRARENLETTLRALTHTRAIRLGDDEMPDVGSPAGEDGFVRIHGTPKTVRLTDGITVEMLYDLSIVLYGGLDDSLDIKISQRMLDGWGVITRDPSVEPNAKTLVTWLYKNSFISPIGNSRYKPTPLGEALFKSVGGTRGTPPPTTEKQ